MGRTLGDLLLTLYEMGFTERQVRDALRAGCLSAPEAANWLLQERAEEPPPPQSKPPRALKDCRAMDAFNPPRKVQEASSEPAAASLGCPTSGARAEVAAKDPPGRAGSQAFAEQQREQLAEELRAERRTKRREHELALQRIADDRRRIQGKAQLAQEAPTSEKRVQPPSDGQCLLRIRLPSGDSVRQSFPSASPLEAVRLRLLELHPQLPPAFSLLQGFPKRHFGPADLPRSLGDLGLAPSATLCVVGPPAPQALASEGAAGPESPPQTPHEEEEEEEDEEEEEEEDEEEEEEEEEGMAGPGLPTPEGRGLFAQGAHLPSVLRSPAQRVTPGDFAGLHGHGELAFPEPHRWGRGHRMDVEEPMEQESSAALREGEASGGRGPLLPGSLSFGERAQGLPGSRHQWPAEGNLLRTADGSRAEAPALPLAVAQAAELRLQRVNAQGPEGEEKASLAATSPPGRAAPAVPPLFQLSLRGATALLTAPSKQYCSSLASVTPVLAEHLLGHLVQQGLLSPRSLKLFFGCPLQKLRLDCYPYATNQLLGQLRAFPSLRHLSLLACSVITDQGVSVVQHLPRLQHLNLSACVKLTDNCLQFLKGLPQLSHLALDQTHVTDRGLGEFLLSAPPSLTHLSLNQTGVTDGTLGLLPQCAPQLCTLSIKQTGVVDVSALRRLEALQTLHLDGTPVSEASLRALSSHPALCTLTLSGVQSVDGNTALELVSGLPALTQLALPSRHTVTDAGLAALCRLAGLLELDLTDYNHITDQGLQHLSRLSRLRRLSLCNTLATDLGLRHVQGLPLLEELCLDRLNVSSAGVARCIVTLPHLQVLSLASTPVGDTVARLGISRCKQLLKVNLSRTRLTDRGLRFLRHVPLVHLNLDGSGVTPEGVAALLAACPALGSVRASHLRTLPSEDVSDEEGEGPG
ncbi:uncharacterized protein LOC114607271 isoform X2 [Podarcis muralis]